MIKIKIKELFYDISMLNVGFLIHFRGKVKNKAYINAHVILVVFDRIHFKAMKRKGCMFVLIPTLSFYYTTIKNIMIFFININR